MTTFFNFFIQENPNKSNDNDTKDIRKKVFSQKDVIEELKKFQLEGSLKKVQKINSIKEQNTIKNPIWNELLEKQKRISEQYKQKNKISEYDENYESVSVEDFSDFSDLPDLVQNPNNSGNYINEQFINKENLISSLCFIEQQNNIIQYEISMIKKMLGIE